MLATASEMVMMEQMIANTGENVLEISKNQPILLVFLRHFGCTFCREALSDISQKRSQIEATGTRVVFVHMSDNTLAERYFSRYELVDATHVSDPECRFYIGFGLVKGNLTQLFGLQSWIKGFKVSMLDGHGFGGQMGDGFQMPGVFVIANGQVKDSFIHQLSSDRPDYMTLLNCCAMPA
jgi:peroxiredoxin